MKVTKFDFNEEMLIQMATSWLIMGCRSLALYKMFVIPSYTILNYPIYL